MNTSPVVELVKSALKQQSISISDLVKRLGYTNTNKGNRKLMKFLRTGIPSQFIHENLPAALGIDPSQFDKAIAEAKFLREGEEELAYRNAFVPYLRIQCEREIPFPLFLGIILGTNALKLSIPKQFITEDGFNHVGIGMYVKSHFRLYKVVPGYGKIQYYYFVTKPAEPGFDIAYLITGNGVITDIPMVLSRLPESRFELKTHHLDVLL